MAPLDLNLEQSIASINQNTANAQNIQSLEMHPEAYKVKGPSQEKTKPVSASLRSYAHGLYGLL